MKTRATITIDPKLHARAKKLARQRKTSVSGLFEQYIRGDQDNAPSIVDQMIGAAELRDFNDSDARADALSQKYLKP